MAKATRLEDGTWVVDHDIAVHDEHAARAYYDRMAPGHDATAQPGELASKQQALTLMTQNGVDSRWSVAQQTALTYCINRQSFGNRADLVQNALEQATDLWSRRVNVRYQRVDTATCNDSSNVVFRVVFNQGSFANALAFFPHDAADAQQTLRVWDSAFTTTSDGRDLVGILTHEIGHTLGFRHEHIWINPACSDETISNSSGKGARLLTEYDPDSVMHYPECRPVPGGGYRPSERDYRGAMALYGMAPSLMVAMGL